MNDIAKVDPDHFTASRNGLVVGRAKRTGPGYPWVISKIQWRGANGDLKVVGFPGGELIIGMVDPVASKFLQSKLVAAMLRVI